MDSFLLLAYTNFEMKPIKNEDRLYCYSKVVNG